MDKDQGNETTQKLYEMAVEPIFIDRSQDKEQEVSWEVSGETDIPLPPQLENEKDNSYTVEQQPDLETKEEEAPVLEESESEIEHDEPEKKKKKNRISEKNRIAQLTRELKHAQSFAHDLSSRNQYLESKITQKEKEAHTTQENYLNAQKERIKKYLTDAIEEGDPAKITEANDLLSQYNSEILLLNRQKQYTPPENPQTPQYKQPEDYNFPTYTQENYDSLSEWKENNTWANEMSEDFDRDLYNEADEYSLKLMKKYTLSGRKSEIGSSEFFNEITDYIHSRYEIDDTPPPVQKTQSRDRIQMKQTQSPPVNPVNRDRMQGSESPRKPNDIVLTQEQKDTAHSLAGYVRDPKTGQRITDTKSLEDIYKRNLMRGTR